MRRSIRFKDSVALQNLIWALVAYKRVAYIKKECTVLDNFQHNLIYINQSYIYLTKLSPFFYNPQYISSPMCIVYIIMLEFISIKKNISTLLAIYSSTLYPPSQPLNYRSTSYIANSLVISHLWLAIVFLNYYCHRISYSRLLSDFQFLISNCIF